MQLETEKRCWTGDSSAFGVPGNEAAPPANLFPKQANLIPPLASHGSSIHLHAYLVSFPLQFVSVLWLVVKTLFASHTAFCLAKQNLCYVAGA